MEADIGWISDDGIEFLGEGVVEEVLYEDFVGGFVRGVG